ncbi:MAG: ABC transporter ATP-binding protein [Rhodospirillaceae bacterium]|jgi:iron complex transport system ATP-binding protein|nr:ABC transporter ATP-binding protein [Rhodospirillaceae bacterium]MBT5242039.1 ABC transporter ATP-binding protein [Rhodospirillaceae bacterium]MBT5565764.1 ABC transporter ATP-binding protein [Rhodospirillaceae bacterium]MBT6088509.1 ABC transporter ATP-binding protein [Rhodospirillaceae bacterium]MBT6960291.1 ABC transporter ATP-binding protein [Rhodospirillaceae bacterium]
MTTSPHFEVDSLSVQYDDVRVLDQISFAANGGSLIGLIGPNGAGKTTLIKAMAGLLTTSSGTMSLDAKPLAAWSQDALAQKIGYLSQSRIVHWPVTVDRLVSLGRLPHRGPWDGVSDTDQAAIDEALALTDVEALRSRTVTTLSGGELARVLLARVLAGEPQVILADEPVSGLDPGHRLQVLSGLKRLSADGRLVVVVLHDLTLASRFCDRLILLHEGCVAADGTPEKVLGPEILASVYGVKAVTVSHGDETTVLPWSHI